MSIHQKVPCIYIIACTVLLPACSRIVFYPNRHTYTTPEQLGLAYEEVYINTEDNERLHGWFLLTTHKAQGTVFYLHGNAQNISAHINNVSWLPAQGYQVFLLDYRGYGDSSGTPTIEGALKDIQSGFEWLSPQLRVQKLPLYLLGQSLGASLGGYFVATQPHVKESLNGVILDAGFANLRTIAREKLRTCWLTWPLHYPLSILFTNKYNLDKVIHSLSPIPLLIIHSDDDNVIPASHGRTLYELADEPKYYMHTTGPHISTFMINDNREQVTEFMKHASRLSD
ncbi:MAG: alpha/beta hydrolase [bacterium]